MPSNQWDKVKEIFSDAVELPVAERAAFIALACEGEPSIQRAVERLLSQADLTDSLEILPVKSHHALATGEQISERFRILRFVGAGGMGEVYEAEDLELGGTVALKTLKPALLADPQFLGRFRREVQLSRQVTHPNICRIFDVGNDTGRVFLTMEFLDGETLSAHLRRVGRLPVETAARLIRQMAEGLAALHDKGIVHRDLKPGNVMITATSTGGSRAVITDFGLARTIEKGSSDATSLSITGHVMGTPDYMAPEQLRGEGASRASDIYALGLVMYEMVTGKKAYPGGQAIENAVQRAMEAPPSPREHAPEVSPEWETLILRCLDRDPARRPASAAEVLAGLAGQLPPPPAPPNPRRTWLIAAGIVFALVATFFVGSRFTGRAGISGGGSAKQHVALLPLSVLANEPELRVFALGLMDTITSRLSQYDGTNAQQLLVVPASEVRSQKAATAGDAQKMFGVTAAVEGSLQAQGDRVRLMLTLIDTEKKLQLESITIEEQRSNALGLQDAAVTRLANALNLRIQARYAREQAQISPLAPGAYEYYLQGRGYLQRPDQVQSLDAAVTVFERSLKEDPKYALAHSGLGEAYLYKYELSRDPQWMEKAIASGQQGLDLNPNVPETHTSLGRVFMGTGRYAEAQGGV